MNGWGGGCFLIQKVNLQQEEGHTATDIEIIGHERSFMSQPSAAIKSRHYDSSGETLDHVYESGRRRAHDLVR